jgi:sugar phosphate isomerase/epimerase
MEAAAMPRVISINTLCLEPAQLDGHIEVIRRLGATAISPQREEIEATGVARAGRLLREANLSVVALTHRAFGFSNAVEAAEQRERLSQSIDLAHAIGADAVCLTSGGRGDLPWKEAAARFAQEIAPCVEKARAAGVALGLEPTSHLYADASIAHRLADVVTLARRAGVRVGIDLFACWVDADLEEAIAAASPLCAFVQVSDYVSGDRGLPCRAVPGDGVVPLDRIVRLILASGYRGPFDLEIIGPRLIAEGREAGLRRAMTRLQQAIDAALSATRSGG